MGNILKLIYYFLSVNTIGGNEATFAELALCIRLGCIASVTLSISL